MKQIHIRRCCALFKLIAKGTLLIILKNQLFSLEANFHDLVFYTSTIPRSTIANIDSAGGDQENRPW